MLEILLESGGHRSLGAGPRMVALSVHGVVVLAGGLVTHPAPPIVPRPVTVPIEIFGPAPPVRPAGSPARGGTDGRGEILAAPDVPVSAPAAVPAVAVPLVGRDTALDARTVAGRDLWGQQGLAAGPGSLVKLAGEVDEQVVVLRAKRPRYPPALAAIGVSGQVRLAFVVDTLGRCEPGSVRVLSSTHPGFESAASDAVLGSAFRPARVRGAPVPQLVQQNVVFRLQ